jgi:hypothetical protein
MKRQRINKKYGTKNKKCKTGLLYSLSDFSSPVEFQEKGFWSYFKYFQLSFSVIS